MAATASFLSLAPELRNRIYDYFFVFNFTETLPAILKSPMALASTCRQLYEETYVLAVPVTPLRTSQWHLEGLLEKIRSLPPSMRPFLKSVHLSIESTDFLFNPRSLEGLKLASAGLTGIQELRIDFMAAHASETQRETYIISNLQVVLWKTVVDCSNSALRRIWLVHRGQFSREAFDQLHSGIQKRLSVPWARAEDWACMDPNCPPSDSEYAYGDFYLRRNGVGLCSPRAVHVVFSLPA
jgi:hypothetical protein